MVFPVFMYTLGHLHSSSGMLPLHQAEYRGDQTNHTCPERNILIHETKFPVSLAMTQAVNRRRHRGGRGSIPRQSMSHSVWTQWQ